MIFQALENARSPLRFPSYRQAESSVPACRRRFYQPTRAALRILPSKICPRKCCRLPVIGRRRESSLTGFTRAISPLQSRKKRWRRLLKSSHHLILKSLLTRLWRITAAITASWDTKCALPSAGFAERRTLLHPTLPRQRCSPTCRTERERTMRNI